MFFFIDNSFRLGTDTVKRGVSPGPSLSNNSLQNGKITESISTYSFKQDNLNKGNRDCNTIERSKFGNALTARNVLFASDVGSSSSYSLSDQLKSPNPSNNAASTSQLIKQALSPLAQHRNISQSNLDSIVTTKNQTNNSSLGSYQFPSSNNIHLKNLSTNLNENQSSLRLASSPSRSISNTNTLPSSVARNMLYQSDSNYSLKNQQINFTSPSNGGLHSHTNTNIYGTLPKSTSPFTGGNNASALYGNTTSSIGGNEFDKLIAKYQNMSSGSNNVSNSNSTGGNYNTLGSYRVQYSSTNPFLPSFNPDSNSGETG